MPNLFRHPIDKVYNILVNLSCGILKQVQDDFLFLLILNPSHAEFISASHALSIYIIKSADKLIYWLIKLIIMLYKQGHIYIMSNTYRTTFYIGVTSDLRSRVWQHINGEGSAFVKKYKLYDLIYYEYFERITDAIDREKQLKNWHQDWKINLIKSVNPDMKDLKAELELT